MNPIFVKGFKNILRNRYRYRKKDGSFTEYNESITALPNEFSDQDEYKTEKFVAKLYEDRYKKTVKMKEKLYTIQLDKKSASISNPCRPKKVSSDPDSPVQLEDDPYKERLKKCVFCRLNLPVDYKNTQLLSQFTSPQTGLMYSQQVTGLCIHKYEEVEKAIKKARKWGLMPFFFKESTYVTDPKLFEPGKNILKSIPDNLDKRKLNE